MAISAYSALVLPLANISIVGKEGSLEALDSEYHALEADKSGIKSQCIIICDIDEQTFLDFTDPSDKRLYHSYLEYMPKFHLLLIEMTTEVLEQTHLSLHLTWQADQQSNVLKKKTNQVYPMTDKTTGIVS